MMMRQLLVAALITTLGSVGVGAQAAMPNSSSSVVLPADPVRLLPELTGGVQGPLGRIPTRRCCSRKGALIGAVIGTALAILLTRNTCDAGDCTSTYAKSIAILGGIGAGLGAFTARPSINSPVFPRTESGFAIAPVAGNGAYGGVVSLRFGTQ
jgi:hypothetical protein